MSLIRSRWFWIFLIICIVEEATFFCPFLSLFLLAATFSPKIALVFARTFVTYYNQTQGTNLQICVDDSDEQTD